MPRNGRPRKPTHLKLLAGTHRVDRHGKPSDEANPLTGSLAVPDGLGAVGVSVWVDTAERLSRLGLFTELDRRALHTYCLAFDEIAKCTEAIDRDGAYYVSSKGTRCQHPAVSDRRAWLDIKRRYEIEFAMTPSSRSGLKVEPMAAESPKSRKHIR